MHTLHTLCPCAECEDGEERVFCLRRPCEDAVCPELPEATCVDDYCGGCNVRWMLEGEDVTERCCKSHLSQFLVLIALSTGIERLLKLLLVLLRPKP